MKIGPNQSCPCCSDVKYKKCCRPFLDGDDVIDHPERLIRARHTALVVGDADFLWKTLHPQSPRKLHDREQKFKEEQVLLKNLHFDHFTLLDGDVLKDKARLVVWVKVHDGPQDLSYLEEAELRAVDGRWYYFDGLRRSELTLGCLPESLKVGELANLFPHESALN